MNQLTKDELIKVIALKAAARALTGKIQVSATSELEVIRWAEKFEQYLKSQI